MTDKKVQKTGLNLYRVTFYYHTNGCVYVKAASEEEALELADGGDIPNEQLLEGLQKDGDTDAELVEENVESVWTGKDSYGNDVRIDDQIAWFDENKRIMRILKVCGVDNGNQSFSCTDGKHQIELYFDKCIRVVKDTNDELIEEVRKI